MKCAFWPFEFTTQVILDTYLTDMDVNCNFTVMWRHTTKSVYVSFCNPSDSLSLLAYFVAYRHGSDANLHTLAVPE